jgi:hypothetical protein
MRKIVTILAVLLLASPAMAAVTVSVADNADLTGTISYNDTGDPCYVRAFALDITVDGGAVITGVTAAMSGDCNATDKGYGIFPGSFARYVVAADPNWADPCYSPLGYPDDLPGDTQGGLGTSGITVEMGSLYVDGNAPPSSGVLCTVTVSETCNMTVVANAGRAGVVLEDASAIAPDLSGATGVEVPCEQAGCLTCQGDWDEDGNRELVDDLMVFMAVLDQGGTFANIPLGDPRYNYCGDWDGDGNMELVDDLMVMMAVLDQGGTFANLPCP